MSEKRRLAWRGMLSIAALWAVVTAVFAFVTLTPDPNEAIIEFSVAQEAAGTGVNVTERIQETLATYRETRNRDEPIGERYVTWLRRVATLQLGVSYQTGQPVIRLVGRRLAITLGYVVPGTVIATIGGVIVGTYAGLGDDRWSRLATLLSYTAFGVPTFWLAAVAVSLVTFELTTPALLDYDLDRRLWSPHNLQRLVLPTALLGTGLLATQARFVRTQVIDTQRERFVTVVRSKGAGRLRVARHVLRVAALPLVSVFVAELLGTLLVTVVVVEFVLELPGFGTLTLDAIQNRDLPVIVGTTLVVATVGIVGNFLQDVAVELLDPRLDS